MISLQDYLVQENIYDQSSVDEGLLKKGLSLAIGATMPVDKLEEGIISMYDYICNKDDIKLFYMDFSIKDRVFWENMYKLYEKGVWNIFDVEKMSKKSRQDRNRREVSRRYDDDDYDYRYRYNHDVDDDLDQEVDLDIDDDSMTKITPQQRKELRGIIDSSRNKDTEIKPAEIEKIGLWNPESEENTYILVINKTPSLLRRIFRAADVKMLENIFNKLLKG